jgi:hypothetical protein
MIPGNSRFSQTCPNILYMRSISRSSYQVPSTNTVQHLQAGVSSALSNQHPSTQASKKDSRRNRRKTRASLYLTQCAKTWPSSSCPNSKAVMTQMWSWLCSRRKIANILRMSTSLKWQTKRNTKMSNTSTRQQRISLNRSRWGFCRSSWHGDPKQTSMTWSYSSSS